MPARFRQLALELGPADAALYLLSRACARLTGGRLRLAKYYLFAQPVADAELTPPRRGRAIEVREATVAEMRAADFGRPAAAIEYRIGHRCRCLLARKGDELLGFQWFTLADYPEDTVRCRYLLDPRDRCAWDFDIYVRPEARTQPTFLRLWDACNGILRDAGVDLSLSRIDAFNAGSRRSHGRLGARTIGWAAFVSAGPLQLAAFSTRPWLHLSLSPSNIPAWPVSSLARNGNRTQIADSPPDRT
jgi:hypothetical protein